MNRNDFLKIITLTSIGGLTMNLKALNNISKDLKPSKRMPIMFFGHGSPMNAIENNEFTQGWTDSIKDIQRPAAIICISAHWETNGTLVTAMEKPRTIHDFGGFPKKLYEVQYPAPGNPELAKQTSGIIPDQIRMDLQWGLDHGTWSVIKNMYPNADIPVLQLSLDYNLSPQQHYELARQLTILRDKGVLLVGSGNIVHNLGRIDWENPDKGSNWAEIANSKIKELLLKGDDKSLIEYKSLGREVQLSVPTAEHYLPMLYILGLKGSNESLTFFNDKCVYGSLSMTSLIIE
jgi:4,5-DOPA dioxygenase extradiol